MSLGNKMFNGMVWSAFERISVQSVSFILGIILANLLTPTEYGTVAILLVFIGFSQVFIDSGFSKALIQKQDRSENDISTVFLFNIFVAVSCCILLWFFAPFVASFYETELLETLLRVASISLIFNALYAIPFTLYTIDLNFKAIARVTFASTLISGLIAVYLAYMGYGVWALVWQTVIKSVLTAIFMWTSIKWKPNWVFSKDSLKNLFSYGSKLLASSLLNNLVNNFYALFIAKWISKRDLGYYDRGAQNANTFFAAISAVFDSVLLPGLATVQEQTDLLVSHTRNIIRSAALLVVPLFLGLAVIAEPLIRVLLGEVWMPAVPIMQLICLARLITIVSSINVNVLYVIGRTDLALKQQYLKIIVRVILLVIALPFGIVYIALAELISTIIHFFINTYYPGKIMNYGAIKQIKDIFQILMIGCCMAVLSLLAMHFLNIPDFLKLVFIPLVGGLFYVSSIKLMQIEEYDKLLEKVVGFLKRK